VAVILAAGRSTRLPGDRNKVLLPLGGETVLVRATRPFVSHAVIDDVLVVAAAEEAHACAEEFARAGMPNVTVIAGAETRHGSEWAALRELAARIEQETISLVVIHDAARPLYRGERLEELLAAARESGGAILAVPVDPREAILRTGTGDSPAFVSADGLWRAQTPQAFQARVLLDAYTRASDERFEGSDTSSTVERFGTLVRVIVGDEGNLKITYPPDLDLAESLLQAGERR
jgi:2-C-methyl-D-erythritol 4-phosphate cytidylyltransferase